MNENEKRGEVDIEIHGPIKVEVTHQLGHTWILVAIAIALIVLMYNTCRADTTKVLKREVCRIDTIYVDDPRCHHKDTIPLVRARGLDSVYTLPHDSIVWSLGPKYDERGNPNRVTLKIPGAWWYFDWDKGKRTNLRSKP